MFKFLRKYNKYILAVGGTLLLITFLIPYAFTNLLQGVGKSSAAWAYVGLDKKKVTVGDLTRLQRELQFLQMIAPQGIERINRPEYWYLLCREADEAGLIGSPSSVARTPEAVQRVQTIIAASRENPEFVLETLAKIQGVERLFRLYLDAGMYSDRRLKHAAQRLFHRETIQAVVIPATEPDPPRRFTDAELIEQMNEYADVAPGGDASEHGFGYRLPDRVKIEWLTIRADQVRAMLAKSDRLDGVSLYKHWLKNPDKFGGAPEAGADIPQAVRDDLLAALTAQTLDEIAKFANDGLRIKRRVLPQRGGYYELAEGWQDLSFETLALDVQDNFGVALPEYHARGAEWMTAEDLPRLDGVGAAASDKFGTMPVGLAEIVMSVRELGGTPSVPVQVGVAGPPLRGADGSVYFVRVLAAEPSRPPASIDEVRDEVITDLNRLAHYEQLVESADSILEVAVAEGLIAVGILYDMPVTPPLPTSVGRPANLPVIGASEEVAEAMTDFAMALPTNVPVADLPESKRMLVVPVDDRLCLVVARINDQTPLSDENYADYVTYGLVQRALRADEYGTGDVIADAFGYDVLAKRHNFELSRRKGEVDEEDETAEAAGL